MMTEQEIIDALALAKRAIAQVQDSVVGFNPRAAPLDTYKAGETHHNARTAYYAIHELAYGLYVKHGYPEPPADEDE